MTPEEWIISDDTGISSKAIWAAMMGVKISDCDVPHDPSDFGRCHRLLEAVPGWKEQLQRVADAYPRWQPMVDHWQEMERLYLRDLETGRCPELYAFMKPLVDEGRIIDGWVRNGLNGWKKEN